MIRHELVNVLPVLIDGQLKSIRFTLIASEDAITEHINWNTPASLPVRGEPYTQADYVDLAGSIAAACGMYTDLNERIERRKEQAAVVPTPPVQLPDAVRKAEMVKRVDDHIAEIITRSTRFSMGYVEREAEATRYRDSGYEGEPNEWVMDFARAVKIPARMATDIILTQAAQLRKANKDLESLRMQKYLITNASSMAAAEAQFNHIIRAADAIGKTL